MGYCFVEMADEATAERCLRKINGKSLPGASPVRLGASVNVPLAVWSGLKQNNLVLVPVLGSVSSQA